MSGGDVEEIEQMRSALLAIADEVQKFHNEWSNDHKETWSSNKSQEKIFHSEDSTTALMQCKSTLKLKKEQNRILRQHLKTACLVAKTLSAAKERETASLNNQLNSIRSEYWALVKQDKEKNKLIYALQADNEIIQDKLQYLNNFIRLGYQGLQNVQNEKFEDTSSLKQLQKIIFYCGQYYADYCNQCEQCMQLEQKNRFLNSKLRILESNLEISSNELQNLTGKVKPLSLAKSRQSSNNSLCTVSSESQTDRQGNINRTEESNKPSLLNIYKSINLTCHLGTIKKLLHDQDSLLEDLKCISKDINVNLIME